MKERVKQIRRYFALSQEKFAKRINKTTGFISNVEIGRAGMSDDTIQTICDIFGIDEEWLRNGTGDMFLPGKEKQVADKSGIGERIKQLRKHKGLTQEQFGYSIGYHKNHIYYVEIAKHMPSDDFISKVCKVYKVRIDWLRYGEGEMTATSDGVDEELIEWLRGNPDVVRELRLRSGLD